MNVDVSDRDDENHEQEAEKCDAHAGRSHDPSRDERELEHKDAFDVERNERPVRVALGTHEHVTQGLASHVRNLVQIEERLPVRNHEEAVAWSIAETKYQVILYTLSYFQVSLLTS